MNLCVVFRQGFQTLEIFRFIIYLTVHRVTLLFAGICKALKVIKTLGLSGLVIFIVFRALQILQNNKVAW